MKSLLLLRHAEALAADGGRGDEERVLSRHGHAQARALGRWLKRQRMVPDQVLCSGAKRARQTAKDVMAAAGWPTALTEVASLYDASASTMLALVQAQADDLRGLLVVAHAPGVGELAALLASRHADLRLACEPATLIEVVFDCATWSAIGPRNGVLRLLLPA